MAMASMIRMAMMNGNVSKKELNMKSFSLSVIACSVRIVSIDEASKNKETCVPMAGLSTVSQAWAAKIKA